jgi:hypothetical protein
MAVVYGVEADEQSGVRASQLVLGELMQSATRHVFYSCFFKNAKL